MLKRVHTALRFSQFVCQPPDRGREHRKLRNFYQNLAERGAGFIQNSGCVAVTRLERCRVDSVGTDSWRVYAPTPLTAGLIVAFACR